MGPFTDVLSEPTAGSSPISPRTTNNLNIAGGILTGLASLGASLVPQRPSAEDLEGQVLSELDSNLVKASQLEAQGFTDRARVLRQTSARQALASGRTSGAAVNQLFEVHTGGLDSVQASTTLEQQRINAKLQDQDFIRNGYALAKAVDPDFLTKSPAEQFEVMSLLDDQKRGNDQVIALVNSNMQSQWALKGRQSYMSGIQNFAMGIVGSIGALEDQGVAVTAEMIEAKTQEWAVAKTLFKVSQIPNKEDREVVRDQINAIDDLLNTFRESPQRVADFIKSDTTKALFQNVIASTDNVAVQALLMNNIANGQVLDLFPREDFTEFFTSLGRLQNKEANKTAVPGPDIPEDSVDAPFAPATITEVEQLTPEVKLENIRTSNKAIQMLEDLSKLGPDKQKVALGTFNTLLSNVSVGGPLNIKTLQEVFGPRYFDTLETLKTSNPAAFQQYMDKTKFAFSQQFTLSKNIVNNSLQDTFVGLKADGKLALDEEALAKKVGNIGTKDFLKRLNDRFDGDVEKLLASPSELHRALGFPETPGALEIANILETKIKPAYKHLQKMRWLDTTFQTKFDQPVAPADVSGDDQLSGGVSDDGLATEALVNAVIQVESAGNPNAVSPVGAAGLMQVMPDTARQPGNGVTPLDWEKRFDPKENKRFGTEYLNAMLKRFGNIDDALAAYNWGPTATEKWIERGRKTHQMPQETIDYIKKVRKELG